MKYLELWRNELVLKLKVTPLFLRFLFQEEPQALEVIRNYKKKALGGFVNEE